MERLFVVLTQSTLSISSLHFLSSEATKFSSSSSQYSAHSPSQMATTITEGKRRLKYQRLENGQDEEDNEEEDDDVELGFAEDYKKKKTMAPAAKKGPTNGAAAPSCQADSCSADLGGSKRYHRRHKVCELHAKAPAVVVAGLQQRFCQQCSRFHGLQEFDETKRSCRKRLAGHNQRRRKSSYDVHGESST